MIMGFDVEEASPENKSVTKFKYLEYILLNDSIM